MLQAAELGQSVDEYEDAVPGLRVDLVNAQYDLQSADFPVVILISGDDQLAARVTLRGMHEWMDGRYIDSNVFEQPTDEEMRRPESWRYWRRLPRKGRIGAFLNAWVSDPFRHILDESKGKKVLVRDLAHVKAFEEALVDDGALLIKLWYHTPKNEFKKRIKRLEKKGQDWRVNPIDRLLLDRYEDVIPLAEELLSETSTGSAPWHVVESTDRRHAGLATARILLSALRSRLDAPATPPPPPVIGAVPATQTVLDTVDLSESLEKQEYNEQLNDAQARLRKLSEKASKKGIASVLAFEGWDAAGKGGAIRRLTAAIDIRDFRVIPVAAPTEEEAAHHYLWRFWTHVPPDGKTVVFDRTWYGRVLVERVEGFAREDEWRRAYGEIRDFEAHLAEHGIVVLKFWLHVDADEQLARFKAREKTSYKKHKITEEDYRNREKWDDYVQAVNEMVARTSTPHAPWHLVPANDKRHARVQVIQTYAKALEQRLEKD
jgi:polyphosphate:AMP phosphotransferase